LIRVSTADPTFNRAYLNAFRALERELGFERPSQYGQRWREAYKCRAEPAQQELPHTYYIFDHDEDYTLFMLKWS
jgi:hypothetical protein